jgi:hypothetical protein
VTALTPAVLDVPESAALIALFAEAHGDTRELTAERQRVLFAEVAAYEDGAMRRAIEQGVREMAGAA